VPPLSSISPSRCSVAVAPPYSGAATVLRPAWDQIGREDLVEADDADVMASSKTAVRPSWATTWPGSSVGWSTSVSCGVDV
jgi:hypothetical protein